MSTLRARCPDCRTLTAVAFDDGYECHSCGAAFAAGLVRVPRAWGTGGETMARAAATPVRYPEALVVAEDGVEAQAAVIAAGLPQRPLVLGGCCCAHLGAIRGLAARHGRLAVVWLDAHGDLNTPETSPLGERVGDAAPPRARRGVGRAGGRRARGRARPRPARGRRTSPSTGSTTTSNARSPGTDAVYVALDVRRARAGHGVVLHARARRARTRRGRGGPDRRRRPEPASRGWG